MEIKQISIELNNVDALNKEKLKKNRYSYAISNRHGIRYEQRENYIWDLAS